MQRGSKLSVCMFCIQTVYVLFTFDDLFRDIKMLLVLCQIILMTPQTDQKANRVIFDICKLLDRFAQDYETDI